MKYKKIGKAIGDLIANYEDAIHTDFVYKPISYALYQTWKKWDEKEEPRKTKNSSNPVCSDCGKPIIGDYMWTYYGQPYCKDCAYKHENEEKLMGIPIGIDKLKGKKE